MDINIILELPISATIMQNYNFGQLDPINQFIYATTPRINGRKQQRKCSYISVKIHCCYNYIRGYENQLKLEETRSAIRTKLRATFMLRSSKFERIVSIIEQTYEECKSLKMILKIDE